MHWPTLIHILFFVLRNIIIYRLAKTHLNSLTTQSLEICWSSNFIWVGAMINDKVVATIFILLFRFWVATLCSLWIKLHKFRCFYIANIFVSSRFTGTISTFVTLHYYRLVTISLFGLFLWHIQCSHLRSECLLYTSSNLVDLPFTWAVGTKSICLHYSYQP